MQDKDMDQLFRSKLDNYEMEPSASVWANISQELGGPAQRKSIVPMLRIAASVAVVISAGLFFLVKNKADVEPTKGGKKLAGVVKQANPVQTRAATQTINQVQPAAQQPVNTAAQVTQAINTQPKQQIAAVKHQIVNTPTVKVEQKPADPVQVQTPDSQPQPVLIAAVVTPKVNDTQHAMPDGPISKPVDVITGDNGKGSVLASTNVADDDAKATTAKKRKATGLGGFLNKVIAAVDKRDDKIIEFTDTDEGDAITGINLGIFKVKKQK